MDEMKDTLCVYCKNACNGGCSWSENLTPVNGWTAEKNEHGYMVLMCPKFVEETKENKTKNFDKDGMALLYEAIGRQMRDDYIHGISQYDPSKHKAEKDKYVHKTEAEKRWQNRRIIEKWILGPGRALLELTDPEMIITHLRKMARMYENSLYKNGV